MGSIIDFFHKLTNPDELGVLIDTVLSGWWFYGAMFLIVFAETGVLLGFILPGDSLLFALGVVAGSGKINIFFLDLLLIVAAIVGDNSGYFLGRKTGPKIFTRPDSLIFKQEYINRTKDFYQKYGGKAIIFARYVPVIRSFTPFMAGVGQMPYRTFFGYSVISVVTWVLILTTTAYFLGSVPLVRNNFEKAILLVVAISFLPAIIEIIRHKMKKS
ncbi:MAG: VTT domain-containing protein [Candidatus Doudnabacteria bacterium]|nr:VTT domain-containing protein [Candidatus Doudnabacteria bacterium]